MIFINKPCAADGVQHMILLTQQFNGSQSCHRNKASKNKPST